MYFTSCICLINSTGTWSTLGFLSVAAVGVATLSELLDPSKDVNEPSLFFEPEEPAQHDEMK